MARIECVVDYVDLTNDRGHDIPGVIVTCKRCTHEEESFGEGDNSVRRCLALLRENCPMGENNFYVEEGEGE